MAGRTGSTSEHCAMSGIRRRLLYWIGLTAVLASLAGGLYFSAEQPQKRPVPSAPARLGPPRLQAFGNYTLWWDDAPRVADSMATSTASNLRPQDYAGPESCQKCHPQQHAGWSNHAHRWMNARIEDARVVGNFADQRLSYLGGEVQFYREGDAYCMRLTRGDVERVYEVTQTIGSRFFQYYVGRLRVGPEPSDHPLYQDDHVLPLGYWISREEWVPVVHVHGEVSEDRRHDPFVVRSDWPVKEFADYAENAMDLYRSQCNFCHTTFSAGDMFVRHQQLLARHLPAPFSLSLPQYVQAARPELWPTGRSPGELSDDDFATILKEFRNFDAREHAVTLGVSCEACHLGCREHVEGKLAKPKFFPHAPEAVIGGGPVKYDLGRTHENVNWACGRCHAGNRPQLAAGMSTWNSTEYSDAQRGGCYSQLTCTKCHDPHQTLGQGWTRTPLEDDDICLSCHKQLTPPTARTAHTRHSLDNAGARCMNCHMPRLNEGLEEVVRTHMIFSPTSAAMIESNQPNACNQCHVDRSIRWTLAYLEEWYGNSYSARAIQATYGEGEGSATVGWLKSKNESVRLIAADSLSRANATWALPELIDALDDPYLLNRQFAEIGLERMLEKTLNQFGYHFYQTPDERRTSIEAVRRGVLRSETDQATETGLRQSK